MDEASNLPSYLLDTTQHNLMEDPVLHEVGEEAMRGVQIVDTSMRKLEDMPDIPGGDIQEVKDNQLADIPTVAKNQESATIQHTKELQTSIACSRSDLKKLVKKIGEFRRRIKLSEFRLDPKREMFLFELEVLQTYINQTKCDLRRMAAELREMLSGKLKACRVNEDEGQHSSTEVDELSDVEDNFHEFDADDDTSPLDTKQNVAEAAVNISIDSLVPSTAQSCKAKSKLNAINGKSTAQDCKAESEKLDTSNAIAIVKDFGRELEMDSNIGNRISMKKFYKPGMKCRKGKVKFQCHLCGVMTEKGNDHMKEKHPEEREFPCSECCEKFDDFESMCYHKLIHKQKRKRKPEGKLLCGECGKICNRKYFKQHQLAHTGEKPHQCEVCGKGFRRSTDAKKCKHSERVKVVGVLRNPGDPEIPDDFTFNQESCLICGGIYRNIHFMRNHLKLAHNVQAILHYPCVICAEILYSKVDFHNHMGSHSPNKNQPLKCKICDESFEDAFKLRGHLLEHNKKYVCDFCGKKFFKAGTLEKHRKFHSEQVTCQVCGRIFRSQRNLEEHMNRHTGEKPFECNICHMKLVSASALQNHKSRRHPVFTGGVKCLICGEMFTTPFSRNTHHLCAHTEEERRLHDIVISMYKCDICGKTMRAENKTKHLWKHKKQGINLKQTARQAVPRICELCGVQFSHTLALHHHKRIHHNWENPKKERFRCEVCGKGFTEKLNLVQHHRIHTGEKPYNCHVCGSSFRCYPNLKRHVTQVHDKERRFQCEFCSKRFAQKSSLDTHRRIHTGEKPYACSICGRAFSDNSTFNKHKRLHDKK